MLLGLVLSALAAAMEPFLPALMKPLLDNGFTQGTLNLWMVPLAIIGVFLIRGIAQFTGQYALARIANAIAAFRRREDPQLFHRRLETSTVRNAAAILLLYLGLTFAGAAVISTAEELPLGACLYETASAAGTVGLTLGLTPQLGVLSQSILILLMFFGRVGGLTLIYAAFSGHDLTYARYPQEKITVG